jgi:internalin A
MSKQALRLIRRAKAERVKKLDLSKCGITNDLPDDLGELVWLEELSIGGAKISDITMLSKLKNLQTLVLTGTLVVNLLPLQSLTQLRTLVLGGTPIIDLSPLSGLKYLSQLLLNHTAISNLGPLSELLHLQILQLINTKVEDISPLSQLMKLKHLGLNKTFVSDVSPLSKLLNLEKLWLNETSIADIGPLSTLVNLKSLHLQATPISEISPLSNLRNLEILSLHQTNVVDLLPLSKLAKLQTLSLWGTKVRDLNPLGGLTQLRMLHLQDTEVSDISPLLQLMTKNHLEVRIEAFDNKPGIFVYNCPLTNPPIEIAKQGNEAILRYWERQEEELASSIAQTTNWHCKLVIVGNGGVGKSTFLQCLKDDGSPKAVKRTKWLDIAEWKPNHVFEAKEADSELSPKPGKAIVQVFDFGGQEYYHDTHHLFFSTNTAYLVLWNSEKNRFGKDREPDEKNEEGEPLSFHYPLEYWLDAIRHLNGITVSATQLDQWISQIDSSEYEDMPGEEWVFNIREKRRIFDEYDSEVEKIPALVVQTHIDHSGIQFLDQLSLTREFPWIMDFESVSLNPKKPMRVEVLKAKLLELIGKIPILGTTISTTYTWIREAVQENPEQVTLPVEIFMKWVNQTLSDHPLAKGRNMNKLHFGLAESKDLITYLGSLGYLLHYPNTPIEDKVFLRPDLLKVTILDLLQKMRQKRGFFSKKEAAEALKSVSHNTKLDELLALMQQFKMAFQIGPERDGLWAAPLYLSEEAPEGIELLLQVFDRPIRRISFRHFIHKSVVLEFFQQHVHEIKSQADLQQGKSYLVWRNGMVLQTPDSKELVLVRFFMGESEPQFGNSPKLTVPAHIDVFSFGQAPKGKGPAEDVLARLKKITQGWRVEEAVTVDGSTFIPLSKLEAASSVSETHFLHNGKTYALEEYSAFVDIPWDRLYISYAEEDEAFCKAFEKHIWPLQQRDKLIVWSKGKLIAGMETDEVQRQEMQKANIVVLLLSADYFYNRDIWNIELKEAMKRAELGECTLAVIVVRDCDWKSTTLASIHHLHKGKVIGEPGNDKAWNDVVTELKRILKPKKGG